MQNRTPISFLLLLLCAVSLLAGSLSLQAQSNPARAQAESGENYADLLRFSNASPQDLIGALEIIRGKAILLPQNLPGAQINFSTDNLDDPFFTREEAVAIIETLLAMHGVTVIEIDDKTMRAVPVPVINANTPEILTDLTVEVDDTNRLYAALFQFEHIDLEQVQQILQPLLTP
ncbi:MAG: hypothetical protein ACOCVG_05535, partial [Verrucomicrobiota bacterium]